MTNNSNETKIFGYKAEIVGYIPYCKKYTENVGKDVEWKLSIERTFYFKTKEDAIKQLTSQQIPNCKYILIRPLYEGYLDFEERWDSEKYKKEVVCFEVNFSFDKQVTYFEKIYFETVPYLKYLVSGISLGNIPLSFAKKYYSTINPDKTALFEVNNKRIRINKTGSNYFRIQEINSGSTFETTAIINEEGKIIHSGNRMSYSNNIHIDSNKFTPYRNTSLNVKDEQELIDNIIKELCMKNTPNSTNYLS